MHIDDIISILFWFVILCYKKRVHSMLCLISNRSHKTSKCGKISDTLHIALCATVLFLTHFEVICDLLYASIITHIRSMRTSEEGQYIGISILLTLVLMFGKDMVDILQA